MVTVRGDQRHAAAGACGSVVVMFGSGALALTMLTAVPARAQEGAAQSGRELSSPGYLEEIVVTAQKREENVNTVPIAISVFDATKRESMGILTVQDLTNVTPGLVYNTAQDKVFIRGIGRQTNGVGTDPGVALYNDGFYAATTTTAANSPLFTDRIEVLRGPQGTLYGRNSIGGAINVISARPTREWYGEVRGLVANFDRQEIFASVSGPLSEHVRMRVNASYVKQDEGYFENVAGGPDEGGVADDRYREVQLEADLGSFDVFLRYAKSNRDDRWRFFTTAAPYDTTTFFTGPLGPNATFGSSVPNPGTLDARLFNANFPTSSRLYDNDLVVANVTWHQGSFDIKYIGGYQAYVFDQIQDFDNSAVDTYQYRPAGAPVPLTISGDYRRQYIEDRAYSSHEINIISTTPGPLQWILGLYYYRERFDQPVSVFAPGQAELTSPRLLTGAPAAANPDRIYNSSFGRQESNSSAVFGQLDYDLTEQFHLTAGVRWSRDEKEGFESTRSVLFNPALGFGIGYGCSSPTQCFGIAYEVGNASRRLSDDWSDVSGTLGVEWQPTDAMLTYLKYSRGFKSGGFNLGSVAPVPGVDSETLDAYEIGLKLGIAQRLQTNVAIFQYQYHDMQVPLLVIPGANQVARADLVNLDRSRVYGVELDVNWAATDRLSFNLAYSWLDTEITDACCFVDPLDRNALLPGASPATPPNAAGNRGQDLSGNALPASPANKVSLAPSYRLDLFGGTLLLTGVYAWRDVVDAGLFANSLAKSPSYDQVDLRATFTFPSDRFSIVAFGRNVLDDLGYDGVGAQQITGGVVRTYSLTPPRTYGVELQARF